MFRSTFPSHERQKGTAGRIMRRVIGFQSRRVTVATDGPIAGLRGGESAKRKAASRAMRDFPGNGLVVDPVTQPTSGSTRAKPTKKPPSVVQLNRLQQT